MEISIAAIICAAGSSSRMGGAKKEYLSLEGKNLSVLGAALEAFASCARIGPIVITIPPGSSKEECIRLAGLNVVGPGKNVLFVHGGLTRRASVHNALSLLESSMPSHVLIHDGARPWIRGELIERIIDAVINCGAVIPALPLTETPKLLHPAGGSPMKDDSLFMGLIKQHLRRAELCTAQTPQGFKFPEILAAHLKAREREDRENFDYTDDAEVWGEFIGEVAVIRGDPDNRKITYPEDLYSANAPDPNLILDTQCTE